MIHLHPHSYSNLKSQQILQCKLASQSRIYECMTNPCFFLSIVADLDVSEDSDNDNEKTKPTVPKA